MLDIRPTMHKNWKVSESKPLGCGPESHQVGEGDPAELGERVARAESVTEARRLLWSGSSLSERHGRLWNK